MSSAFFALGVPPAHAQPPEPRAVQPTVQATPEPTKEPLATPAPQPTPEIAPAVEVPPLAAPSAPQAPTTITAYRRRSNPTVAVRINTPADSRSVQVDEIVNCEIRLTGAGSVTTNTIAVTLWCPDDRGGQGPPDRFVFVNDDGTPMQDSQFHPALARTGAVTHFKIRGRHAGASKMNVRLGATFIRNRSDLDLSSTSLTVRPVPLSVALTRIEFTSDHGVLRDSPSTRATSVGTRYTKPDVFVFNGVIQKNNPLTQTKNTFLTARVTFIARRAGISVRLLGRSTAGYATMSSEPVTSTGALQSVKVQAKYRLPNAIRSVTPTINWQIVETSSSRAHSLPSTSHEIFVLWATPIETVSISPAGNLNTPTVRRMRRVTSAANGAGDIHTAARGIQRWRDTIGPVRQEDISPEFSTAPANLSDPYVIANTFWGMADGTNGGHCAQGAVLMELAMKQLGIPATYFQVLPSRFLPALTYNPTIPSSRLNPDRNHPHGNVAMPETLWMWFENAGNLDGWNDGEGCVQVGSRYYTAFAGGKVGQAGVPARGTIWPSATVRPQDSVLRQLGGRPGSWLQRWRDDTNGTWCNHRQNGGIQIVP